MALLDLEKLTIPYEEMAYLLNYTNSNFPSNSQKPLFKKNDQILPSLSRISSIISLYTV